jgi:hypothetical protein
MPFPSTGHVQRLTLSQPGQAVQTIPSLPSRHLAVLRPGTW